MYFTTKYKKIGTIDTVVSELENHVPCMVEGFTARVPMRATMGGVINVFLHFTSPGVVESGGTAEEKARRNENSLKWLCTEKKKRRRRRRGKMAVPSPPFRFQREGNSFLGPNLLPPPRAISR